MASDEAGWDVRNPEWPVLIAAKLRASGLDYADDALETFIKLVGFAAEDAINAERNRYNHELKEQAKIYEVRLKELHDSYDTIRTMVMPLLNLIGMSPFEKIVSVALEMPDGEIRVVHVE